MPALPWTPGQWWRAPRPLRFYLYYMNLRRNYRLRPVDAYRVARKSFAIYPTFFSDPGTALRRWINRGKTP